MQDVGDAVDQHGGFSAAGTCQNEDGSFGGKDGFPLHGVEIGKAAVQDLSFELLVCLVITLRHEWGLLFFVTGGTGRTVPPCNLLVKIQDILYHKRTPEETPAGKFFGKTAAADLLPH